MKKLIMLVGLFMVFTSCEKEFKIKINDANNKIVVNTIFDKEKPIAASVTRSFSPYEKIVVADIDDASVKLYENGAFVENLSYTKQPVEKNGKFLGTVVPKVGKKYTIEVRKSGMEDVKATSQVPDSVSISAGKAYKVEWGEYNITSFRYNFSFTITDGSKKDFYYLTMAFPVLLLDTVSNTKSFYAYQYVEIKTASLPEQQLYTKNGILFDDLVFNGSNFSFVGTATTYAFPFGDFLKLDEELDDNLLSLDTTHLHVQLHHLSKELYHYYSSRALRLKNENDVYAEPSPIYSNVENGLGIFGGENVTLKKVLIE